MNNQSEARSAKLTQLLTMTTNHKFPLQVFGKISLDDDTAIHSNNNFQTFEQSILGRKL